LAIAGFAVTAIVLLTWVLAPSDAPRTAGASCGGEYGSFSVVGRQAEFHPNVANGALIDARGAEWNSSVAGDYPVVLDASDSTNHDVCWSGGTITGDYPAATSWETYPGTSAMTIRSPGFTVQGVTIDYCGDGRGVGEDASGGWTIRDAHMINIHDDCVENDYMHDGLIENSLLDGCYVAFSARGFSGQDSRPSGLDNVLTIRNTLVRLQPMPTVYDGPTPGHGGFFKWPTDPSEEGYGTMLSIHDSIFRADQAPNHGDLGLPSYPDPATGNERPYLQNCSNNIVVWLGRGRYPDPLPDCFTLTTDISVWNTAVDAWTSAD
jgi:hypothetical protein